MTVREIDPYLALILVGFLPNEIWRWLGIVVARGLDERSEIVGRRQGDRPGAEDDEAGWLELPNEPHEPHAERRVVGRLATDEGRCRAGLEERDAVSLGEGGPGVVEDGRQRPGTGVRRGGENEDGHGGGSHARSLATERCAAVGRVRAYVGLGANVGSPAETLAAAVHALAALPGARIRGVSRLYATDPVGVLDQPEFRNAVVALDVPALPDPERGSIALISCAQRRECRSTGLRWRTVERK